MTLRTKLPRPLACVLLGAASVLFTSNSFAKEPSNEATSEAIAYYDLWLGYQRQYQRIPGIQVAIRQGDRLALSRSYGEADAEQHAPLRRDHLFRIASHSKTFAAISILQLVEQGKLRLDDSLGHWLPWLAEAGSPLARTTVGELLSHSTGIIRDGRDSDFWQLGKPFPNRDELKAEMLSAQASVISSNEHFKYSNIGYGALGLVIEAASGTDFNAYVTHNIIDRLSLKNLGPEYDPARENEYATGYSSLLYADHRVPIDHVDTRALSAATGFYANAEDLTQYFSSYYFGDERLISDASKRRMFHPVWVKDDNRTSGSTYGLGVFIEQVNERTLIGHSGGYPGHITNSLVDPKDKVAVSVLTNALGSPVTPMVQAAYKLIDLANKPSPETGKKTDAAANIDPHKFTGRFASLWSVFDVAVLGGRLYMLYPYELDPAKTAIPLTIINGHTLRVDGGTGGNQYREPMVYEFGDSGKIVSVRQSGLFVPYEKWVLPDRVRKAY